MINGAHVILYSKKPDADRAFLQRTLGLSHVDAGGGWLIFALPPAEVAVHPASKNSHELYLMCDDVNAFIATVAKHGIRCSPVSEQRWGLLTTLTLPGGGKLGVYEPRHARPSAKPARATPRASGGASKRAAPKKPKRAAPKKPKHAAKASRK
ncbi:MAG TPA: hypothetical protein VMI54_09845 [Polyangiaceae bacterium]|nr:hypothetical protein [Polyangiaceae bacterium]